MWKLVLICILTNYSVYGANIMGNFSRVSWIKKEDFETTIKLSFPRSKCCNIFIDGHTVGIEILFNQFRTIYPSHYHLRRKTYDCDGYFLLASSAEWVAQAMTRVPTIISTTEILIMVDDKMNKSSTLLNASIYENSNVNILSKNAMWSLSENFLFPRVFKNIKNYYEMRHQSGIVDLQGRQLQVAAIFNPPMCYLSTTVNKTVHGIEGEFFVATNELELDGMETKIFLLIAQKLNFTWLIRKPSDHYKHGRKNGSIWSGGIIGQAFRKEVDIAFGEIWLTYDTYEFVNLTKPWFQVFIQFLVPRPKPRLNFWALTRPLSIPVWIAVIMMVLIQSCNIYIKAWINPHVPERFKSFTITITELIGRLLGTWSSHKTNGVRLQFHLWHIAGVLVVTTYCSSLASRLTTPDFEDRIDTLRQFIDANLTWGREGPVPNFEYFFNLHDTYAKQFPSRFQSETSSEERHEKIRNGHYAIIGKTVDSIFYPEDYIASEDFISYRLMRQYVGHYYTSFAVQPWLLESVDKVIMWLSENGLIMYHIRDVIHRRTRHSLREVLVEHDLETDTANVLLLKPLGAGFLLLFAGYFVATVVFYFELTSVHPKFSLIQMIKRSIRRIYSKK